MLKPQQSRAAQPQHNVWVSASAGTGKTKVLIARLLRLLLAGSAPEKILCITYTKTAAAEVLDRLQKISRAWAILDTVSLARELFELTGENADEPLLQRARSLFARIVHASGGMRVLTIHAFCQSILSRFPIEAGVPTHFTVADESKTEALLHAAKHHLLWQGQSHAEDFARFMDYLDEDRQNNLLQNILAKRHYLYALMEKYPTREDYRRHLCALFNVSPQTTAQSLEKEFRAAIPHVEWKNALPVLLSSTSKTTRDPAAIVESFLSAPDRDLVDYLLFFLTKENEPRKKLFTGLDSAKRDQIQDGLDREQIRVTAYAQGIEALKIIDATASLYSIVLALLAIYQSLKREQSLLDYEDQIAATRRLLCDSSDYLWVLYKLDHQIEHVLVDEAQDTSPAQWDIVDAITDEFFAGEAAHTAGTRTAFVVGDEKQSIFSFQNAYPEGFFRMGQRLGQKTDLHKIALIENFRSSPLVLALVDQVFADPALARSISRDTGPIRHIASHMDMPGKIHLWPLQPRAEDLPSALQHYHLAQKIAQHVDTLLQRPDLRPGDVMILVHRRQPMAPKLMKAFRDMGIPINGPDRTILGEHLAVQDCLSMIQYALNPQDNYNTACLLKSPFIGMDDDALLALRYSDIKQSLHANLCTPEYTAIKTYLDTMAQTARTQSVPGFIHAFLDRPCPYDPVSGRQALIRHLGYDTADILEHFIDAAYGFADDEPGQLQQFHTYLSQQSYAIKKDQSDKDPSYVQLSTVHSSKGLEAKIVILADATSRPLGYRAGDNVVWLDDPASGFVWPIDNQVEVPFVESLLEHARKKNFDEYYRLLYVALTRPKQELIICGCESGRAATTQYPSWYEVLQPAVEKLAATQNYTVTRDPNGICLSLGEVETAAEKTETGSVTSPSIDQRLHTSPPIEQTRTKPLRPSQPLSAQPAVISPLHYAPQTHHFQRGQLIHRLFRVLPEFEDRDAALQRILEQEHYLSPPMRKALHDEILGVLQHPQFAEVFSTHGRSEVPLIGDILLNGKPYTVSGQVDRLVVTPERVLIVDYKTNRPAVQNENEVPEIYRLQMLSYKLLLEKIYPDRPVQAALLWTAKPYLMPLSL